MAHHAARTGFAFRLPGRVGLSGLVLATATSLVGAGAFAAWNSTSTTGASGTYSAATVTHSDAAGGTGLAANSTTAWSTGVTNLLDGDFLYRYRTITNTGSVGQTITGVVSSTGALTAAGGLQMSVEKCTAYVSAVCSTWGAVTTGGTMADVAANAGFSLGSVAAAGVVDLRVKFLLPTSAVQATFQGTSGTVTVAFTGATSGAGSDRTAG